MDKSSLNEFKNSTHSQEKATTQSSLIQEAFEKYYNLMFELSHLCRLYHSTFNEISRLNIRESILHKEVSEARKQELDRKLTLLEEDIKNITNTLVAHLDRMEDLLKNEAVAIMRQEAFEINRDHISAMCEYRSSMQSLKAIQKYSDCPERMRVSLYTLETKKKALHIAIKEYNDKNLRLMDYKLMDVLEAEETAKNEMYNMK